MSEKQTSGFLLDDLDALRAENERLRAEIAEWDERYTTEGRRAHECAEHVERLQADVALLHAVLEDIVESTRGALIVQDYGRLNRALLVRHG